ncbi:UNVERIFIED_CONTAM: hypothetical protein PYX00_005085 [Menopon gallinae]|uniref:Thioredoxin domain-containing protein 17 n=1 Tax=Menopon gallinae TaxID=328185 RepID=A0AAW2HPU5_9NEOP
MITHHKAESYEECLELLNKLKDEKNIVLYFSGALNEKGENWCPDCRAAEPIVEEVLKENEHKTFHFVHVNVGSREEWKNPNCPFRKNEEFKLTSIPTLMMWKSVERLNDAECQDKENIAMILEAIN